MEGLTGNVFGVVNYAFEGGENEVIINQEFEEAFHGGMPRVRGFLVFFGSGGGEFIVAESHGDEPHLFGDSGGLSGIEFPIPTPLLYHWLIRSAIENDSRFEA